MRRAENHYVEVFETRLFDQPAFILVAPPVKVALVTGPVYLHVYTHERAVLPLRGELDEELRVASRSSLQLESEKRYILVSTRTREPIGVAEEECRRLVERTIGIVGLLTDPHIFALPIYRGWAGETANGPLQKSLMFCPPVTASPSELRKSISVARNVLSVDAIDRQRFDLVARLFARTIGSAPSEESILWAWTCLEVYPMKGTQKYALVAPYLATVTGIEEKVIARQLGIRELHMLRSKLVHAGAMGLSNGELHTTLNRVQAIVRTVMRGMCGLPYDRALDRFVAGPA